MTESTHDNFKGKSDGKISNERRDTNRAPVNAVVGIDSSDRTNRVGVTRNLSNKGALFHSASKFSPGERLSLKLRAPGDNTDHHVTARVVRTELEDPTSGSLFCHLTAVEFEQPLSE